MKLVDADWKPLKGLKDAGYVPPELMPAYYMMAACIVGLVALRFMPETAGLSLRDRSYSSVSS